MNEDQVQTEEQAAPASSSRRGALGALTVGGAAVVGAIAGGGAVAARQGSESATDTFTIDCALLGQTWRMIDFGNEDPGDLRGSPFSVEGILYPGNHIPDGDGFSPTEDQAIGHWFCRGHMILNPSRTEPHIMSDQEYFLNPLTAEDPVPLDLITSTGLEGVDTDFQKMIRAVTGGTGAYRGAAGQIAQYFIGTNATIFTDVPENAPNIRFEFDLILP